MTSFVSKLYSQLEHAYGRPFLTVLGEFEPENVVRHRVDPKCTFLRHSAYLQPIGTNFGLHVRRMEIINCARFYRNRLKDSDSVRGRSLTILIGLRCRR